MSLLSIKIFNVSSDFVFQLLNIFFFTIWSQLLLSLPCLSLPFVVFVGWKWHRVAWVSRIMRKYVHWWHFIWILLCSFSRILRILLYLSCWLSKLLIRRICCGVRSPLNLLVISYRIWRHMHHIPVVMLLIRMHVWHRIWIRWIHWWVLVYGYMHWGRRKHIWWIISRMLVIVIFIA